MSILLVEDDENKRNQILSFLHGAFPQVNVQIAKSVQSGLKAIVNSQLQLILLDMTMPTFDIGLDEDGGRPQPFGGREILRQMNRREMSIPVIVVTQFDKFGDGPDALTIEELHSQLLDSHSESYVGYVYYNVALEGWKEELTEMIQALPQPEITS